jgi:hypothetical protein
MRSWGSAALLVARTLLPIAMTGEPARADEPPAVEAGGPSYEVSIRGETHAEIFRRALLPGTDGALVSTATVAPIRQYVRARARALNTDDGALDFELAGWSGAWLGDAGQADGDVQIANAGYRRGVWALRLGRQQMTGGAARFSKFDGLALGAELGAGIRADVYAGFTVLPRWNERTGYHYLGSATLADLRNHEVLESEDRKQHALAGGRLGWSSADVSAGVSFHEQHGARGLVRRNLGARARGSVFDDATVGADGLLELDSVRLVDARLFFDWVPLREFDLSVEYLHTEPALLLPRDSVLSVFSTDAYDEAGGSARARPARFLVLEATGFAQFRPSGHPGARSELAARVSLDERERAFARIAYSRVLTPDSGYHALRSSLRQHLLETWAATLEAYGYFYDRSIRGRRVSSVFAGTLSYEPRSSFSALFGASLAQSPYARFDAQTQVALAYDFDFVTRRGGAR